ncbi:MAG TPA: 2Fe-2S iron-sulfur cluster-binding protein, partial [Trebonia sp.]
MLLDGAPARSCLLLAVQCEGADIRTVEGLSPGGELHPLQQAFTEEHALQCGFCTPGFLMLLAGELAACPELDTDPARLDEVLASNLCRCTGYHGIRRAAVSAARRMRAPARAKPARREAGTSDLRHDRRQAGGRQEDRADPDPPAPQRCRLRLAVKMQGGGGGGGG